MHKLIVIITSLDKFEARFEVVLYSRLLIKSGYLPQIVLLAQLKMIIYVIHYVLCNLSEQIRDLVGHLSWYDTLKHLQILA